MSSGRKPDATPRTADVAVVGGGAAGLATAIFAARARPGAAIVVLDGAARLGAKILVSGGGRCNVTNARVAPADFWQPRSPFVRRVLRALDVERTVAFFREIGVALHEEPGGKLFPDTHRARTVLDALLAEAARLGIRLQAGNRVKQVERSGDAFVVEAAAGVLGARAVVLATGGMSLPKSGSDGAGYDLARRLGHSIVPPTPALAPLVLEGDLHARLQGVAHEAELVVRAEGWAALRIRGPLLFTHFGLSGPAAMNASRFWHRAEVERRAVRLSASFLPDEDFASLEGRLLEAARSRSSPSLRALLASRLPASLAEAVLEALGIAGETPLHQLRRADRRRLVAALLEWPLPVRGSRGYNFAEATSGGVPLGEVDAASMASRRCPGLHLVGEVLDVDGRIGGFNFQWAWSTGFVAGRALAARL